MKIFTYASGSDELPANERAIARIKCPMPTGFGKTRAVRDEWHPVIIYADTQAAAAEKAQAWWDGEVAKERAKAELAARRSAMMRARSAVSKTGAPQ